MAGPSYLGIAQWAVAADPPPSLRAMAASISSARVRAFTYPGGDLLARQHADVAGAAGEPASGLDVRGSANRSPRAGGWRVPPDPAARRAPTGVVTGARVRLLPGLARAHGRRRLLGARRVRPPSRLAHGAGDDGDRLVRHVPARATRGLSGAPWRPGATSGSPSAPGSTPIPALPARHCATRSTGSARTFSIAVAAEQRSRVRLFVGGARRWLDVDEWPPPARSVRWHLHSGGVLHPRAPVASAPDRYRYDPSDPTPSVGGSLLARSGGPRDNRALERRSDVLVFSSAALVRDLEVIGPITAELHVRSTLEHTDFFVRLCDVEPSGKSLNLCDGLVRLTPGSWRRGADGIADGRRAALAGRACLSPRSSAPRAGVERRAPQVRAQPRWGRTARHRGDHAQR